MVTEVVGNLLSIVLHIGLGTRRKTVSFLKDFTLGGASGAVAKTLTAPIGQAMYSRPPCMGIVDYFRRVAAEQGLLSFWRGNLINVIRYFPAQAFNFAFKDSIKLLFPRYDPTAQFGQFFLVQMTSGGKGKGNFNSLADSLAKTARGPRGLLGLYNGFGVSVAGTISYRGIYFGLYDSLREKNPMEAKTQLLNGFQHHDRATAKIIKGSPWRRKHSSSTAFSIMT
ncbi:ADP/ATP translocase [Balamuthia mandrillaris]